MVVVCTSLSTCRSHALPIGQSIASILVTDIFVILFLAKDLSLSTKRGRVKPVA